MLRNQNRYFNNEEQLQLLNRLCSVNEKYGRYTYMSEFYRICDAYFSLLQQAQEEMQNVFDEKKALVFYQSVCSTLIDKDKQNIAYDMTMSLFENTDYVKQKILRNQKRNQ